eukprot:CAMPEP_0116847256 /NCGR_PEP_ID=MMETSP0418-20121206/14334_1 /TAXON_ID=1158023 /ORGANISM="Astrosyne radiata, Strain 13vi08-1A" /LENGTH=47 /DNA_ID= /DNA_START= /DNA_END= /DNA_ORIENTATION=
MDARRFLQPNETATVDQCFCSVNPTEFRGPTREEFEASYNNTVVMLV